MWDKLSWLNQISSVLIILSLLTYLTAAWAWLARQSSFAIRQVLIQGHWRHVDVQQVKEVAIHSVYGNFFSVNLDYLRHSFELIPWVSHVFVERLWPWRVAVVLYEHTPVARWGHDLLVSGEGILFSGTVNSDLPRFVGPDGTQKEMLLFYKQFNELVTPLHLTIHRLDLTPSYAWDVVVDNDVVIHIGSDYKPYSAMDRVDRFVRSYKLLKLDMKEIRSVDLRYPNGFAIRFSDRLRDSLMKRGRG